VIGETYFLAFLIMDITVADAVDRLDGVESGVDIPEFLADALDVAVDRPVIDIQYLAIGEIHQLFAGTSHGRDAR